MRLSLLTLVLVAACHTSSPARPPDATTTGTMFDSVCDHLGKLGCPEARPNRKGRTCFQVMANASLVADVPSVCILQAWSPEDVRACGDTTTIRVRCAGP
jgi:hypothetical protein